MYTPNCKYIKFVFFELHCWRVRGETAGSLCLSLVGMDLFAVLKKKIITTCHPISPMYPVCGNKDETIGHV